MVKSNKPETQAVSDARLKHLFPKLDGLTEIQLIVRCHGLDISSACSREAMIAGIRRAGAALVGKYVPGGTLCPDCAGKVRVASSPRGPIRYHCQCPACGASVKTEKLWRPIEIRRPAQTDGTAGSGIEPVGDTAVVTGRVALSPAKPATPSTAGD